MASLKEMMAAKKKQIAEATGNRARAVTPPPGTSRWRILPSWRGESDLSFYHDFGEHFIKDESGKTKAVYVCVDKTYGKPCAICEAIRDGINSANDDDTKNLLGGAKATQRILLNAVQVDKDPKNPVVLSIGQMLFDKIIDIIQQNMDEDDENFNIVTDISNGVDLIITRTGTGLKTEYGVQPALKGSKPVDPSVLEKMTNLDEYVAQEQEAGLLRATSAVKSIMGNAKSLSGPSSDSPFEDDIPDFPETKKVKAKAVEEDIIEGDYSSDDDDIDELNNLLDELED